VPVDWAKPLNMKSHDYYVDATTNKLFGRCFGAIKTVFSKSNTLSKNSVARGPPGNLRTKIQEAAKPVILIKLSPEI
jgi:hypothetical protein